MEQSSTIQIKKEIPSTHFFVHKNERYPFNMDLFKLSSNYFTKKRNIAGDSKFIELLDQDYEKNFDISHESITDFIRYLHRSAIQVHKRNVVALNYLGRKYEIEELIQNTEEYISNHHSELSLEILTIQPQRSTLDTTIYESSISDHFLDYINNDQIFKLDISTLHRIFQRYRETQRKTHNQDISDQIFPFLFKCLDKYGRRASVLFNGIELDKIRPDFTKILMEKYSNILDFHYVNPSMMKLLL